MFDIRIDFKKYPICRNNIVILHGICVNGIAKTGPADKAGIKPGSVITHINGTEVGNTRHLLNLVSQVKPGNPISVKGINQNGKFSTKATVIQRPVQEEE